MGQIWKLGLVGMLESKVRTKALICYLRWWSFTARLHRDIRLHRKQSQQSNSLFFSWSLEASFRIDHWFWVRTNKSSGLTPKLCMHGIHSKRVTDHLKSELQYKSCPRSRPNPKWHMQGAYMNSIEKALKNELTSEPPSRMWKARKNLESEPYHVDCLLKQQQ